MSLLRNEEYVLSVHIPGQPRLTPLSHSLTLPTRV